MNTILNKIDIRQFIIISVCLLLFTFSGAAKEQSIVGLSNHELGDQTLALNAGLIVPLSFLDLNGVFHPSNQKPVGGAGSLMWSAYLSPAFRIGLELGFTFTFGPDLTSHMLVPILAKVGYVFAYDRFEFPLSLGLGTTVIKYGSEELIDLTLALKPGVSAFYRYDSNFSFGLTVDWMLNLEFPSAYEDSVISSGIIVTPTLFYNF